MKSKNSQITIFIILGIVILVIVIGGIYLMNSVKIDNMKDTTLDTQKIPSDLEPLVNYMEKCIETIAKEGMFLLGEQGGYIYISQGGNSNDLSPLEEGNLFLIHTPQSTPRKIRYRIKAEYINSWACSASLPGYPTKHKIPYPYKTSDNFSLDFSKTTYLNDKKYDYIGCFGTKTADFDPDNAFLALKTYINNTIKTRCNLSVFKNYRSDFQEPNVYIEPSSSTIKFKISYPITLTNINTGAKTTLKEFSTSIKLSLKELYDFANNIIQLDISDPTYNIQQKDPLTGFEVFVIQDVFDNDDVIRVISPNIKLDGIPFELNFARKNRYPALEYVYDTSFSNISLIAGTKVYWANVIHQNISAVDPDGDIVTITVKIERPSFVRVNLTKTTPYTIQSGDVSCGSPPCKLIFNITVADSALEDYQTQSYKESFEITT